MLAFALLFLASANGLQWYQQRELSDFHLNSLMERNCYRGTYGSLTLFNCPLKHVSLEPFAELSSNVRLCVVESRTHEIVQKVAYAAQGVEVLFDDKEKYLVLAERYSQAGGVYPEACFWDAYEGAAWNVMTVSEFPFVPSTVDPLAGRVGAPDPRIQSFLNLVTRDAISNIISTLSFGPANATAANKWNTRNSYAIKTNSNSTINLSATKAVTWVSQQFAALKDCEVTNSTYNANIFPNVLAKFRGTTRPTEIVLLGFHVDSRTTGLNDTTTDAPGADDNGTGSSIGIRFAQLLQQVLSNSSIIPGFALARSVWLAGFSGEEQGLLGSASYAQQMKANNTNIVGMINVDMVGYKQPTANSTLAFMTGSTTPAFTTSAKAVTRDYLPGYPIGDTSACCSDQQSFFRQNYSVISLFETPTSGAVYPDYHKSSDTPDKVNMDQVVAFAKAAIANVLTLAL